MTKLSRARRLCLGFSVLVPMLLVIEGSGQRLPSSSDALLYEKRNKMKNEIARQTIAPAPSDLEAHKVFLKLPNTGIARLVLQQPCPIPADERSENPDQMLKECPAHLILGGGSNFSFRKRDYVASTQADVTIKGKGIYSMGTAAQGIMVSLGDISLDDVSLTSDGVGFLDEFLPGKTVEEAEQQSETFYKGVRRGKFRYSRGSNLTPNATFALRVVAYRANLEKTLELSNEQRSLINRRLRNDPDPLLRVGAGLPLDVEVKSDPLYGDERKDIIVAFRIIKIETDGSVTLIWKELKRTDSPKIKVDTK